MLQTAFHILIGTVFILSIFFGILIWRQSIAFERKALIAKKRKEEFVRQFEIELAEAKSMADPELDGAGDEVHKDLNVNKVQEVNS